MKKTCNLGDVTPEELSDLLEEIETLGPLPDNVINNNNNRLSTLHIPSEINRSEKYLESNQLLPSINRTHSLQPRRSRNFMMPAIGSSHNNAATVHSRPLNSLYPNQGDTVRPEFSGERFYRSAPIRNNIANFRSYHFSNMQNPNANDFLVGPPREKNRNSDRSRKAIPIHQWRISFSGDDRGIHLYDFLSQVEVLRRSERISEGELLESIVHLLSGRAKLWYISLYEHFNTWGQFVNALKNEFLPPHYDYMLLSDISNRSQKSNETFSEFFTHMQSLFRCLSSPISEDYKLYLVRKNLLPRYAVGVAPLDIVNLQELSEACRRIDGALNRHVSLRMPFLNQSLTTNRPQPRQNDRPREINPVDDVDNVEPEHPEIVVVTKQNEDAPANQIPVSNSDRIKCWNCGIVGHRFQNCQKQRKMFCYKCGTQNITFPKCAKCQGNGRRNQGT